MFCVDGWWMFAPTNLPFYTIFDSDAGLSENGFHVLKLRQIAISKQKMTINHGDNYTFFQSHPYLILLRWLWWNDSRCGSKHRAACVCCRRAQDQRKGCVPSSYNTLHFLKSEVCLSWHIQEPQDSLDRHFQVSTTLFWCALSIVVSWIAAFPVPLCKLRLLQCLVSSSMVKHHEESWSILWILNTPNNPSMVSMQWYTIQCKNNISLDAEATQPAYWECLDLTISWWTPATAH